MVKKMKKIVGNLYMESSAPELRGMVKEAIEEAWDLGLTEEDELEQFVEEYVWGKDEN